ncbi:hypothetical protein ACM0AZ_12615 [Mycobacteroides abscessus subsp. massiliense]|uniref:hypothetical protein n=1 Tax=Mycobacteroides abscessus TaxID=36809 RepID=UPI0009A60628|nr:hypothetical protein [Mycobacteroides abscessus]MBN7467070.1 hypothetical protein [Mycobacteroides abscessus subsp. massiliense]SLI53810.1 Uncharacterised protein [Mycobacteroides abscessus subsp. massiliense]
MTDMQHDYPDLPPISLAAKLELEAMEPAHFCLTGEMEQESFAVSRAVRAHVTRWVGHLGQDVADVATHRALLAIRAVIESYMTGGDVTTSE